MSSYRPKIKLNASGETRDLPLDAETLKGKTLDYFASKSEMNSGLANKQNNLSQSQLEAVNSGITSAKVSTYDGYASQINDKATASNVYSKSEVDSKDTSTLNNAKSYTDTQLKTITDNIVKEVICTHQYEITGNTGDEHGLAIEDQQMLIKRIEGQTKVVNGRLVNSNCVLKSSGRNLVDCVLPQIYGNQNVVFKDYVYLPKGRYDIFIETNPKTSDTCNIKIGDKILSGQYTFNTRQKFELDKDYYGPLQGWNNVEQNSVKISIWYGYDYNHIAYEPFKEDIIDGIGSLGQWDYDDLIAQKGIRTTGNIITLNGSEIWENWPSSSPDKLRFKTDKGLNAFFDNNIKTTVSNWKDASANETWNLQQGICTEGNFIGIYVEGITSVVELKQWLAQNPIQLVYKKATPTIVDINLPNGMAVYNGGLQSQIGQVPYKITKQYNLSQKAQTLANIEIDREQQDQINEIKNTTTSQQGQITKLENKVDKFKFNLYRHDCSVATNDGTFYFEFWCDSNTKLDLPSKWQSVKFWGGSGAISNTGSIENGQQTSVFKKGTQLFYYTTSQNNLLIARYINTDNVNTYSVYDFFGNKVA